MTAVATTPNPNNSASAPASSLAAVPRAIWIALGACALATAGLAGALVMNAIGDDKEQLTAQASMQTAPAQVAGFQQQQPQAAVQPSNLQPVAQEPAQAAPAPVAKPKPAVVQKPAPVRQASGSAGQPAPQVVAQAPAPAVQQPAYTPVQQVQRICASCGTVENVQEVREKGQGSGLGAVGGAVVGGLLGNQVGGGNGKKVMTVVGAAGGALAGHQIEKHVRGTSAYDVQVRMEDGSVRTVRHAEPVSVGTRVTVEGGTLRVGGSSRGAVPATVAPRTLHTSAPAMYGN